MAERAERKVKTGVVISDKMHKTITVQIESLRKDPRYGKYVRHYTKFYAHDEENSAKNGDTVEIMETRPLSKNKRWRLVQVVERAKLR